MRYLVLSQALLSATSFGVDGSEPSISLRMERAAMSILITWKLLVEP
jgi:hypothetical protein